VSGAKLGQIVANGQATGGAHERPANGSGGGARGRAAAGAVGGVAVIDLASSLRYRRRHIPGAWWAVRARLAEARGMVGEAREIVLTSDDGVLARFAAAEAAALWPQAQVQVLEGGNAAWFGAGLTEEKGMTRPTTALDDVWYKPYDHEHESDYEKHARAYLDWEVALVEQIRRDPAIRFRAYD
jgi:rhodanese-related sulfurtransferase